MKLLHTGDWHAGKGLAGRSRSEELRDALAEIATLAREQEVDFVLVAGDIFDSAAPSPEAERIVYRALLDLASVAPVIAVPGNHDNQRRLAAIAPVIEHARVTVVPFLADKVYRFESDGERLCLAPLPWLSQRFVVRNDQLMSKDAAELSGDYNQRLRRVIAALSAGFEDDAVNIVLGHLAVAGAVPGGGERPAQVIDAYRVDATAFPARAHYVALGHIHKLQTMPGPCPIYYCGSPLQLDFSDTDDATQVLVIEAHPGAPATVTPVALTVDRRLRTIKGTLEQLGALAGTTGEDYLRVIVTERARPGLGEDVRDLFPNTVKVIVDAAQEGDVLVRPQLDSASPAELFTAYLDSRGMADKRLVDLFGELYEECTEAGA